MTEKYPLEWPTGWPRTRPGLRKRGRFGSKPRDGQYREINIEIAIARLQDELDRIGAKYVVLSTNLETNLRGMPRGNMGEPTDPGVALYFQLKGRQTTLPCDSYTRVADNIAAIAAHIEATRAIERHGVGTLDQMFTGFQAIRGPGPKPWRESLGFPTESRPSAEIIRQKHRELLRQNHPDVGGSDAFMAEINAARDAGLQEVSQ